MADRLPTAIEEALTQAQITAAKAEAAQFKAETRLTLAHAEAAEISLAKDRDEERTRKTADLYHHTYAFVGAVTDTSVRNCMMRLAEFTRGEPGCPIEIVFNSPGGEVTAGLALYDYILTLRAEGHAVTTVALGMAASMAGILLQAGDRRVMGSEAWLMIHEASFGAAGKTGDIEDTVDWVKRVQIRILRIFASRSKLTTTQLATRWRRKNWWLDAEQALKLGLIDEIRGLAA